MGLTSAILTGFTGIQTNQTSIDTIGNNVANVNTTGYKSSRALFETMPVNTLEAGTPPGTVNGGTNPIQTGYGSTLATIQRNFAQGSTERTGLPSDLAIDGEGFFILQSRENQQNYTRDGAFTLNTRQELVSANGAFVQGFPASADGTIDSGNLTNLRIPLGVVSEAQATTEVILAGNFDASSEPAVSGSVSTSNIMMTTGGAPATAATPLTALVDANDTPLFSTADVIKIGQVQKGGLKYPESNFVVGGDGSTLGDLASFLEQALGIDSRDSAIGSPGVQIGDGTTAPAGALVVISNAGDVNALNLDPTSISNDSTGKFPFAFTTTPATGDGFTTSFQIFDSLGTPVDVRLRVVLEEKTDAGTLWRFSAESLSTGTATTFLGDGTVAFDQNGQFKSSTGTQVSVGRGNTGAVNPLSFQISFSDVTGLTDVGGDSTLEMASSDGSEEGTLTGYEITSDGVIEGTLSNGQTRTLGQVALASFANNEGLIGLSENLFSAGANSGDPVVGAPQAGATGSIGSGQLEQSNVDLSRELVGLITASNGFSAAGRVVRQADDMLQELLLLVR